MDTDTPINPFNLLISQLTGNLHENLGLARGIKRSMQDLLQKLEVENSPETEHLQKTILLFNHLVLSLDSMMMSLSTPHLENHTLIQGLSEYVEIYRVGFPTLRDLKVQIEIDELIDRFPVVAEAIFIITKEAIANAIFHGKALAIEVSLDCSNNTANLYVSDNGVGFDIGSISAGSGLKVMRRIANSLNGNFDVESTKNQLTIVKVLIPLRVI